MNSLPASILLAVEDEALFVDVALDILRAAHPDILWADETEQASPPPFGIVRRDTYVGWGEEDHRFISTGYVAIHTFTQGIDATLDNTRLQEAVKLAMLRAGYDQVPARHWGYVSSTTLIEPHRKRSDWQNSEGPVQYADLPNDYTRFESVWEIKVRRSTLGPHYSTK